MYSTEGVLGTMTTGHQIRLAAAMTQERDLIDQALTVTDDRRDSGLDGLVGGLEAVIIATEADHLVPAVYEMLRYTGLSCTEAFFDTNSQSYVLSASESPSVIIRERSGEENPFSNYNRGRLTGAHPNTRPETFIFSTPSLQEYTAIQKRRGVRFLTSNPVESDNFSFIQTEPSPFTGNSLGFIEWLDDMRSFAPAGASLITPDLVKPPNRHLANIFEIDHATTRVKAEDRISAVLEFIALTNYQYDSGIYVKTTHSVSSVTRHVREKGALIFSSGVPVTEKGVEPGPAEQFIQDYGARIHHIAFRTTEIQSTVGMLKKDGMDFLNDLEGSDVDGMRQIFSEPSRYTLIVNEYLQRYGGYEGFFAKTNIEHLSV
jgi:uncharacterized protein YaaQ